MGVIYCQYPMYMYAPPACVSQLCSARGPRAAPPRRPVPQRGPTLFSSRGHPILRGLNPSAFFSQPGTPNPHFLVILESLIFWGGWSGSANPACPANSQQPLLPPEAAGPPPHSGRGSLRKALMGITPVAVSRTDNCLRGTFLWHTDR